MQVQRFPFYVNIHSMPVKAIAIEVQIRPMQVNESRIAVKKIPFAVQVSPMEVNDCPSAVKIPPLELKGSVDQRRYFYIFEKSISPDAVLI